MFDLSRKYGARALALASIVAGAALFSAPAAAQHSGFHGGGYHGAGFHGGYRGGWHGGWGWGVGVGFYDPWWPGYYGAYAPYPYYAEPPTTVITVPAAPAAQAPPAAAAASYYYCDNPAGYYPYVQSCSQPWRQVAAQPQQ